MRGNLRDRGRAIVAPHYGFVDLKHPNVIRENKALYATLMDFGFLFQVSPTFLTDCILISL